MNNLVVYSFGFQFGTTLSLKEVPRFPKLLSNGNVGSNYDSPGSQMPHHLNSDAYEWMNKIPTVPT